MTEKETTLKKKFEGVVVSDAMNGTVVVRVDSLVKHAKYQKFIKNSKRIKAHDPENKYKVGDKVTIEECRPISKDKSFVVVS